MAESTEVRCRWEQEAVAWLQSELGPSDSVRFEHHLAGCAACRRFVEDGRRILDGLRRRPAKRATAWRMRAAAALLLLSAALAVQLVPDEAPPADPVRGEAVGWIQSRLGPEGTWDPSLWVGFPGASIGMHALATMALAEGCDRRPELRADAVRAARWLIEHQGEDGGIGLPPHPLHHPVATVALIEIWHATQDEDVGRAARSAVDYLTSAALGGRPTRLIRDTAPMAWTEVALSRADVDGTGSLAPPLTEVDGGQTALRQLALARPANHAADAMGDLFTASLTVLAPSFDLAAPGPTPFGFD